METKKTGFWIALLVVLGIIVNNVFQSAKALTIRISDFPRNIRNENGALKMDLPFVILNPLRGYFRVSSFSLNMFVNGVQVGNVLLSYPVTISALETQVFPQVIFGYADLLGAVPELKSVGRIINIQFVGAIRVFGISVPVKETISLTIPKLF